jgi:hypothetical protein
MPRGRPAKGSTKNGQPAKATEEAGAPAHAFFPPFTSCMFFVFFGSFVFGEVRPGRCEGRVLWCFFPYPNLRLDIPLCPLMSSYVSLMLVAVSSFGSSLAVSLVAVFAVLVAVFAKVHFCCLRMHKPLQAHAVGVVQQPMGFFLEGKYLAFRESRILKTSITFHVRYSTKLL